MLDTLAVFRHYNGS